METNKHTNKKKDKGRERLTRQRKWKRAEVKGKKKKKQSLLFKLRNLRAACERGKLRVGVKPKGGGHSQNKGPTSPSVFFLVNFVM
jgi:hypothetical protein